MGDQALISELNHFDLFLTGGTILTGNAGQPEIRDGSIGVRDGKITWLGHGTPQSGHTTKRVLKLAGCVVTPGFVNTHTHSILTMVRGVAVDAGFAPSYTPGIPKGPELNPDQARAFARLGALEALLFGSTVLGDHFAHADVATEAARFGGPSGGDGANSSATLPVRKNSRKIFLAGPIWKWRRVETEAVQIGEHRMPISAPTPRHLLF
jgi:hypothetical protein